MTVSSFDLAEYDEAFDRAERPPETDFDESPLPEGSYFGEVASAELKKSKSSGSPMVSLAFKVTSGDHQGRWVWSNIVISSDPQRLGYLKRDLTTLGVMPERLSDLGKTLPDCVGNDIEFSVKHKEKDGNTYTNVYLKQPTGDISDDDCPF